MYSEEQYDEFASKMESKFPEMYGGKYGGFCVDAGWWPIIEVLSSQIDSYTKWRNNTRDALKKDNPYNHNKIPVVHFCAEKTPGKIMGFSSAEQAIPEGLPCIINKASK